jgi:hypothetical protein
LRLGALGLVGVPFAGLAGACRQKRTEFVPPRGAPYQGTDEQLLDDIQKRSFEFFWNEASPQTGQVKDRALANGGDQRKMSSIAATGFGLTALCVGDRRGYRPSKDVKERVRTTLDFLANKLENVHGFYYHFINMDTGARWDKGVELSSIDTSLLLCGVLTARQYFDDPQIKDLATTIYHRVDWPWMQNGEKTLSMGWFPEKGFLPARWNHYCELMMIYLLGIGSPTHPLPPDTWDAWTRPKINYKGIEYISGNDPLFTHQYSQAWFDFRNTRDAYTNYFENSVKATKAHKLFCLSLHDEFPDYSEDLWGISASDWEKGYTAWGGPPKQGPIDGSIVPYATGGSLPFLYDDCMKVLRNIRGPYGDKAWTQYSYVDAFNPLNGWYDKDVLGIDLGITMLMAENHRTGMVWDVFMKNPEAQVGMEKAGFKKETEKPKIG